jgi:alpha-D-ribose 1-methylphosphonate 5-triphosphate synthase subunit PhnH
MNQQTRVSLQNLEPGFQDPQLDAQRVFRQLLQAMARPGQIVPIDRLPEAPKPLGACTAALALTLFDLDTPVWLDDALRATAGDYLTFHTGAPVTAALNEAAFVLVSDGRHLPDLGRIALGDAEYPERAATIIVQVAALRLETGHRLHGPGILGHVDVNVDGLAPEFWTALRKNQKRFPLGFDAVLVAGDMVLALPRTVTLDAMEG